MQVGSKIRVLVILKPGLFDEAIEQLIGSQMDMSVVKEPPRNSEKLDVVVTSFPDMNEKPQYQEALFGRRQVAYIAIREEGKRIAVFTLENIMHEVDGDELLKVIRKAASHQSVC